MSNLFYGMKNVIPFNLVPVKEETSKIFCDLGENRKYLSFFSAPISPKGDSLNDRILLNPL